jgi:hypothetical protein
MEKKINLYNLENTIISLAAVVVAVLSFVYLGDKYLDQRQAEIDKLNDLLDQKVVEVERLRGALIEKEDEIVELRYTYAREVTKKLARK